MCAPSWASLNHLWYFGRNMWSGWMRHHSQWTEWRQESESEIDPGLGPFAANDCPCTNISLSITFKIVENLFFKEKKKIDEGKDQSDASTHKGMPKISSRPAEHRQETQNRFSRLPKEPVLLTSWLWTPGLQDCVTINFCHVSHPRKWIHAPRYPQSIAANSIQGEP